MSPRVRRCLEIYDRHFGPIGIITLAVGAVAYFVIATPFLVDGASSFEDLSLFQILILTGPLQGSVMACVMIYARRRVEKILDSSVTVPRLIVHAQLPPLRIVKIATTLQAVVCGLALDSNGSRRAWKTASDSSDALFLTHFDRYEEAIESDKLEVAHRELATIFNPESMAAACFIVYQLYSEHLKDILLRACLKSLLCRLPATKKLECAIAEFILKDYKASVNFFYSLVADRISSPHEKNDCLRMANLVISAAALEDRRWQRLHAQIFGELAAAYPRITAFEDVGIA